MLAMMEVRCYKTTAEGASRSVVGVSFKLVCRLGQILFGKMGG